MVSCLVPYVSAGRRVGGIGEDGGAAENGGMAGMTGGVGAVATDLMRPDGNAVRDDGSGEGAENKPL